MVLTVDKSRRPREDRQTDGEEGEGEGESEEAVADSEAGAAGEREDEDAATSSKARKKKGKRGGDGAVFTVALVRELLPNVDFEEKLQASPLWKAGGRAGGGRAEGERRVRGGRAGGWRAWREESV